MPAYPEERRPLPPPPLPPRRPLSDFYGRPEHLPQQQQGMYAAPKPGALNSSSKPESPTMPHRDQYGVYGANSTGQYSPPPQTQENVYGRRSNPLYNQPPPVRKSSIPYGHGQSYPNSPFGQRPPSQQQQYGQANPHGQQPYGNASNQAPSPYGKTASPNLIQEPYMQNPPLSSYQPSPPPTQTGFAAPPQYQQQLEAPYDQQPQLQSSPYRKTQSPPRMKSPPLGPPSQTPTLSPPPNVATFQPVQGYNEGHQNVTPANQSQYAYPGRPTTSGFGTSTYNAVDQQQRPSTAAPYNQQGYANEPAQQQANITSAYAPPGLPNIPPTQHMAPQTNDLIGMSSPPLSTQPPQLPQSISFQTLEQSTVPTLKSPPPEPTISSVHPFTPAPQPLLSPAKPREGPPHPTNPLSPTTTEAEAPKDEMGIFLDESVFRYRELLLKERVLLDEGKTLAIPALFQEFMEKEVKIRRERYNIPVPTSTKAVDQNHDPETSVLPSESHPKQVAKEAAQRPAEKPNIALAPVQEIESPPATTFSATLSQVASYMGGPHHPSTAASPSPPPKLPSPPPAPPSAESQIPTPAPESIPSEPPAQEPTTKPFKEHPIPPIPKSESLAAILSSLPELASPDPVLAPLHERLLAIKDLSWVDNDQYEFDSREDKIASELLAASQARQETHSSHQSGLYANNNWEQADAESKEFDEMEQRHKETELKQSITRWRSDYCDPTYSRLHSIFGDVTALHKEIVETECESTEEQVALLNQVQLTLMEVLAKLDIVTDELRRRQHSLKVHRGHVTGDWELISQFDRKKDEEDTLLRDQRGEYRLDKVRLHSQCVKYLLDYAVATLSERKKAVEDEMQGILAEMPESAKGEELPVEGSPDAYPSEELIEQFKEARVVLTRMNKRINALYALLEQIELEMIAEEASPALNKAYSSSDFDLAESLSTSQRSKEKQILDTYLASRETRDVESTTFTEQLYSYISAHNGRKQARLQAIALFAGGGSGDAMSKLMQEQMKTQMVSNMLNTMHMSRMSVINNVGSSNTKYEHVYKHR